MQNNPVDHPESISEPPLESAATGQSEATTVEQNQLARFAFGMQNGEKRVLPNEMVRWLRLGNVKPREAALILCLHDPIHDCGKTPVLFVTEIKARDFEWLLKAFEDVAETEERSSSVRARTLLDWRDFAHNRQLKYHPYFDQFEQAPALIDEVKPPENPQTTAPAPVQPPFSKTPTCSPAEAGNSPNAAIIDSPRPAAEQQGITLDNNGQAPGGDKNATGAKAKFVPRLGWHIAMFEAWPKMRKQYGRDPSPVEAIKYLKEKDTSGVILTKGGINELWWQPRRGTPKELSLSTVENLISSWRTQGVLPV